MCDALGLAPVQDAADPGGALGDLVGLALRRNPRRAHLVVSRVLGKNVPCDPRLVRAAGLLLGHRVGRVLRGEPAADVRLPTRALEDGRAATAARDAALRAGTVGVPALVLGFAENATALGQLVADALDAHHVVASTRRVVPGAPVLGAFEEPHSHAARHLLVPDDPDRWHPDLPLVLVDDEISTGHTAADALRLLHRTCPRSRYVLATLVDLREPGDDAVAGVAAELGVRVDVVALARGGLGLPADVLERGARLVAAHGDAPAPPVADPSHGPETVPLRWGAAPASLRHGMDRADRAALEAALPGAVADLAAVLGPGPGRTLVLGTEELLYVPLRLAEGLADAGYDVRLAATTRSPAIVIDRPEYALRSALTFPVHDAALGRARERYVYNLGGAGFDTVVLVVDEDARTPSLYDPGGLVAQLSALAPRTIEVVVPCRRARPAVPARRGPAFGTFAPDEVGWLLSDLSPLTLETPTAGRERAIRDGRAHYSETLPEERLPTAEYEELFRCALARSAPRLARMIGLLVDRVLLTRGPAPVLVSLARAGTPVAVLMRRWAARVRGVDLPHYAMSVIRGRGLDDAALAGLTATHDPASLVFVDGWTGKGAIVDEVAASVAAYRRDTGSALDPTVVALADPAHCTALHGTREDILVPSACLNATVSGLVSRTVRRPDLVGAGAYDGAKFYGELGAADRTGVLLDAVSACFPAPADAPPLDETATHGSTAVPDRRGQAYVSGLARELGVVDEQRIKAGIGETTRMLLRRDPYTVLLAPDAGVDVDHLRLLCRDRGVPITELPPAAGGVTGPYRSIGLVRGARG